MEMYKPGFMGKVIPADDPVKLTDFVTNKYDSFSNCYDAIKENSDKINSISSVPCTENSSEFGMKINSDSDTISVIQDRVSNNPSISMIGDIITSK